jgi:hypothetical protein
MIIIFALPEINPSTIVNFYAEFNIIKVTRSAKVNVVEVKEAA